MILYWVIVFLFVIGILGASGLVLDEFKTGDGCPRFGPIPACLIILICFILPLISHIARKYNRIYFFFTGVAALIAIVASIMQITGNGACPETAGGTPMCYLSLLIFSTLIGLKTLLINIQNKQLEQNL